MAPTRFVQGGTRKLVPIIALAALVLLAITMGTSAFGRTPRTQAATGVTLQQVVTGLSSPVAIANAGDSRLFIAEQGGLIRIFNGTTLLATPFLNLSGVISVSTERGLLGMAMHPSFASSPYVYVYYTNPAGDVVIARYRVSTGDPNVGDPASALVMLTIPHPTNTNHNGGALAFGPAGRLYVGTGDGGGEGDPANNAQNLSSLLGKILRLDVNAAAPYIAAGNPFIGTPGARGEIWAYGLRNPWRLSFDRLTGDMLVGDVGQDGWEEVNFQFSTSSGGQNYGWRIMEGAHCYNPPTGCSSAGLAPPAIEYAHGAGDCSVTGGYRYRGAHSQFQGTYLYADFCTGRIWTATKSSGGAWTSVLGIDTPYLITSFGEDYVGELYITDFGGGRIHKIIPPTAVGGVAEQPDLTAVADSATAPARGAGPHIVGLLAAMLVAMAVTGAAVWRACRS